MIIVRLPLLLLLLLLLLLIINGPLFPLGFLKEPNGWLTSLREQLMM